MRRTLCLMASCMPKRRGGKIFPMSDILAENHGRNAAPHVRKLFSRGRLSLFKSCRKSVELRFLTFESSWPRTIPPAVETISDLKKTARHLEKTTSCLNRPFRAVRCPFAAQKKGANGPSVGCLRPLPMQIYTLFFRFPNAVNICRTGIFARKCRIFRFSHSGAAGAFRIFADGDGGG